MTALWYRQDQGDEIMPRIASTNSMMLYEINNSRKVDEIDSSDIDGQATLAL